MKYRRKGDYLVGYFNKGTSTRATLIIVHGTLSGKISRNSEGGMTS